MSYSKKQSAKKWTEYLEFEKKHKENKEKTQAFFEYIFNRFWKSHSKKKFKFALEIGIGASGGYLPLIDAYWKQSLDPLWGDVKIKAEDMKDNKNWDLIIISNTLTHCENMKKVVSNIHRALQEDGLVFFFNYLHEDENHPHRFESESEIKKMFKKFEEVKFVSVPKSERNPFVVAIYKKN